MKKTTIQINDIPCLIFGESSENVVLVVHGLQSHKEDNFTLKLAEILTANDYQILSFDLPEHGERKNQLINFSIAQCLSDLKEVMNFCKRNYKSINLAACSYGAVLSLFAYHNEVIQKCCFLSPVIDLRELTERLLSAESVTIDELFNAKIVKLSNGINVNYEDYKFLLNHKITHWEHLTSILYGKKDTLISLSTITNFCDLYHAELNISQNSEHYFHTLEDMNVVTDWIKSVFEV